MTIKISSHILRTLAVNISVDSCYLRVSDWHPKTWITEDYYKFMSHHKQSPLEHLGSKSLDILNIFGHFVSLFLIIFTFHFLFTRQRYVFQSSQIALHLNVKSNSLLPPIPHPWEQIDNKCCRNNSPQDQHYFWNRVWRSWPSHTVGWYAIWGLGWRCPWRSC